MTMLSVQSAGQTVAYINRQPKDADGYRKEEPWLLLYVGGRVDRFATLAEARDDVRKRWAPVKFSRT